MSPRIVVTGASRGIGRGLVEALAASGHELFLVARDPARLEEARADIVAASGNSAIRCESADLSRMSEVRRLAGVMRSHWDSVDVLVNNHAALFPQRLESAEGLEMNFALNHLSAVLLTRELQPALRRAMNGRVLNVAAEAHRMAMLDLDDLQCTKAYDGVKAYCRAKLMLIMHTCDPVTRAEAAGVDVIAAHPGSMHTDALRTIRSEYTRLTGVTEFPRAVDVHDGIAPLLRLVTDEAFVGTGGSYFVLTDRKEPSETARDSRLAAELRRRTTEILATV